MKFALLLLILVNCKVLSQEIIYNKNDSRFNFTNISDGSYISLSATDGITMLYKLDKSGKKILEKTISIRSPDDSFIIPGKEIYYLEATNETVISKVSILENEKSRVSVYIFDKFFNLSKLIVTSELEKSKIGFIGCNIDLSDLTLHLNYYNDNQITRYTKFDLKAKVIKEDFIVQDDRISGSNGAALLEDGYITYSGGRALIRFNSMNERVQEILFPLKQKTQFTTNSHLKVDGSNFLLLTTNGLLPEIHPGMDYVIDFKNRKYSPVLYKISKEGQIASFKKLGDSLEVPAPDNNLIIKNNYYYVGRFNKALNFIDEGISERYFVISKLDQNLNVLWEKTFYPKYRSDYNRLRLSGIRMTEDEKLLVYGHERRGFYNDTTTVGFMFKMNLSGDVIPFNALTTTKDFDYSSINIYPNPFHNSVNVILDNFSMPVDLEVYDQVGRLLTTKLLDPIIVNTIDLPDIPSGSYQYRIKDDKRVITSGSLLKK
jgi:hypothetical protein